MYLFTVDMEYTVKTMIDFIYSIILNLRSRQKVIVMKHAVYLLLGYDAIEFVRSAKARKLEWTAENADEQDGEWIAMHGYVYYKDGPDFSITKRYVLTIIVCLK
jgi:hypothetical protein